VKHCESCTCDIHPPEYPVTCSRCGVKYGPGAMVANHRPDGEDCKRRQAEKDLDTEKELRSIHERTIARIEGFRASWQGRAESAETEVEKLRQDVIRVGIERDAALAKLEEASDVADD
jgi:hypothetical protein